MPDITALVGRVAGVVSLAGYVPYFVDMVRGKSPPQRASWFIWTLVGGMLLVSYYASGARTTIWVPVGTFFGPLIIWLFSFKYGEGGWELLDKICLGMAGLAVLLWVLTGSPVVALGTCLLADFLGYPSTAKKAYLKPRSESLLAWSMWVVGNTINVFALQDHTLALAAYPLYLLVTSAVITALLLIQRRLNAP